MVLHPSRLWRRRPRLVSVVWLLTIIIIQFSTVCSARRIHFFWERIGTGGSRQAKKKLMENNNKEDDTITSTNDNDNNDNTSDKNLTAIVIGAGPSGLAASLALSNVCKKVYLVEKHPTFEKRGATFGMAVNGQKVLDELRPGLLKYMKQEGLQGGTGTGGGGGGTLVFVWWEMRDAFLHHVKQTKNIELYCGEEFTRIDNGVDDNVSVKFKSGLKLQGDLLVAADGVHSKVRQTLKLPPVLESDVTNFRGSLEVPETASPELQGLLDKGIVPFFAGQGREVYFVIFNFHERHPRRLAWILATNLNVPKNGKVTPTSIIKEHLTDEKQIKLLEEVFQLSDKEMLKPYPKSSIVDFSEETLAKFGGRWGGTGRITLLGDAGHGMRPTDGYGGSMALEDAAVLGRILKNGNDSIPNLLKRFEEERLPRVKRVYDNQFERYEIRMREGRNPGPQDQEFLDWLFAGV